MENQYREALDPYRQAVAPAANAMQNYGQQLTKAAGQGHVAGIFEVDTPKNLAQVPGYLGELGASAGETLLESSIPTAAGLATGVVTKNPALSMAVMGSLGAPATYSDIRNTQEREGKRNYGAAAAGAAISSTLDLLGGSERAVTKL